jgi:DNA-binding transcriptional MerR regulator
MKDKLYNMREAAKELGVTRQTLYYWFKKGWVKPKRDYRNFPVFTKTDLKNINDWRNSLHE